MTKNEKSTFIYINIIFHDLSMMRIQGDEWQLLTDNQIDPEEASYMSKFVIVFSLIILVSYRLEL